MLKAVLFDLPRIDDVESQPVSVTHNGSARLLCGPRALQSCEHFCWTYKIFDCELLKDRMTHFALQILYSVIANRNPQAIQFIYNATVTEFGMNEKSQIYWQWCFLPSSVFCCCIKVYELSDAECTFARFRRSLS